MAKILIEVRLPAADLAYDLSVPDSMYIGTLTSLTASVFARLSRGMYAASPGAVLCDLKTGEQYDPGLRVRETGVRNGTKLILY